MNLKPSLRDLKLNLEMKLLKIHGTEAFFGIIQSTEQLMIILCMHTDLPITTLFQQLIHMFQAISQDHTTTAIYQIHTIHMYQDPMFTITQAFILLDMILTIHITAIVDYQLKLTIQDIVDTMTVIIHHIDTPTMLIQDPMIMITCTQDLMFMTTP